LIGIDCTSIVTNLTTIRSRPRRCKGQPAESADEQWLI